MSDNKVVQFGPWMLLTLLAAAFCGWIVIPRAAAGRPPRPADERGQPLRFEAHVRPLFEQHCVSCHGERKRGGLDLRPYTDAPSIAANRKAFASVLENLERNLMPPENKPQPAAAERAQAVAWLRATLYPVDCARPDPGRVTIRRLNRTEYNNTIRDLVGVDFQPAADFPMDDVGYGFDNIGDVLSLPPVLLEKYLAAANRILGQAIVTGPPPMPTQRYAAPKLKGGSDNGAGGRSLASSGEISVEHEFKTAGDYTLRALAHGDQAGPEPVKAALRLGGKEVQVFEIKARASAPQVLEFQLPVAPGRQRVSLAFLNDYYQPNDPDPANRDRNFHLAWIEITGPAATNLPPLPEAHRRIFLAQPAAPTPEARRACARELITRFTERAYRRPLAPDEADGLLRLHDLAAADGDNFEASVKLALTAALVSPHFLFRGELQPEPDNPKSVHLVNEFALASRLSYFLWSTMPDDELLRLAGQGKLRKNLDAQVRRLLKDPRSRTLVDNFVAQWLQFRNLEIAAPDSGTFPGFNDGLRAAMRHESELFAEHILREDRSVLEFVDADWTYVNGPLARHYGIAGVEGDAFQRISLKGTRRGGVLTQGSLLTITSNPTRTSPVKRGKWVLDNFLNQPPPPPPPNVPLLDESKQAQLTGSLRQRFEQHRADPMCASCHALMDPIGFGFENYDGVGAWREKDGEFPVEPGGKLASGETFTNPAELKRLLLTAKRDEFLRCIAAKVLTYALGRGLEYYDQCAVDEIVSRLKQQDYRFSALILGVVHSVPFEKRRGEDAALAGVVRH